MKRVLILCPEPIRPVLAGMGIRSWETARVLATSAEVILGIPNDPADAPAPPGFRLRRYDAGSIGALAEAAQVVVVLGHASDVYFDCGVERPLVVDLYDPFPIENLNYTKTIGYEQSVRDRETLVRQLRHGDFFLCSTDEQRLFYLGMLFALGRLDGPAYEQDASLCELIVKVPFGVPDQMPVAGPPVLRGVLPGVGPEDPILFFGGVYDWYDPGTLLEALPALLDRFPDVRVVFSSNPHPDSTPQEALDEALELARRRGWLDRTVFLVPWVPYAERASLYLESTVGVVLHRPRFETEVSMRTRVLDYLWAGLPVVATEGGGASRILAERRACRLVPPGDAEALVGTLTELLESVETRARLAQRGRELVRDHTWTEVLEPVRSFVDRAPTETVAGSISARRRSRASAALPASLADASGAAAGLRARASRIARGLGNRLSGGSRARRIHLGCGRDNPLEGWWNVDIRRFPGVDQVLDVTRPWPFRDLEYVFAEHLLEHLGPEGAVSMLDEAWKATRVGGTLRLSTPAVEWVLATHLELASRDSSPVEQTLALNRAFYGWGHRLLFSRELLAELLAGTGWGAPRFCDYGVSDDPVFAGLERHERFETFNGFPSVWIVEADRGEERSETALEELRDALETGLGRYLRAGY